MPPPSLLSVAGEKHLGTVLYDVAVPSWAAFAQLATRLTPYPVATTPLRTSVREGPTRTHGSGVAFSAQRGSRDRTRRMRAGERDREGRGRREGRPQTAHPSRVGVRSTRFSDVLCTRRREWRSLSNAFTTV